MSNDDRNLRPSRRALLKGTVPTTVLVSGCSDLLEGDNQPDGQSPEDGEIRSGDVEQTFEFEAAMGGWVSTAPSDIEDAVNPTLDLEAGRTYEIQWTNMDGFEHNFVVLDTGGTELIRTGTIQQAGQTQVIRFTATEEMTQYMCEIHPSTMRGTLSLAGREEDPTPYDQAAVVPVGDSVALETVADGLNAPLGFVTAPGLDDRQFILDQPGQIYILQDDGLRDEPFLDIGNQVVDVGNTELRGYDERGLLGLAFHPGFQENRRFFVRYSSPRREGTPDSFNHTDVLAEFLATEDLEQGIPDSERSLWEIPSPQTNHNAGEILFGPDDGYLYTGIGDGGNADDVGTGHVSDWYDTNDGGNAQNTSANLLGGIHRLDVDSEGDDERTYGIPDDNPFVDSDDGLDEFYAWGFRNPRSMSFDSDGRLFVGDAGQNRFESVYLVEKGGNYSWNIKEGSHCFSTAQATAPPDEIGSCPDSTPEDVRGGEELHDPIIEYPHRFRTTAFIDGSVVIGGHVYEGDAIDHLQDKYVLGNWSGRGVVEPAGEIFVASQPDDASGDEQWTLETLIIEGSSDGKLGRYVYAFGQDQGDELYVLTNGEFRPEDESGEVHKLVPPDAA